MKKLVTATTLTAGIGTALVGQAHHADAAENYTNYNNYNYNTTQTTTTTTTTTTTSIFNINTMIHIVLKLNSSTYVIKKL